MDKEKNKKSVIHDHFIYKQHPKRYPQQHDYRECGLFTVKAVIESYHPELNQEPIQYASSRLQKLIKFSTPKQMSKMLNQYNIPHISGKYQKETMLSKIDFLKKHIKDGPVIVLIAHAYSKGNMFNIPRAIFALHYISIRGYDDEQRIFYCYDSHTSLRENDLPTGNLKL